ncbi:hypothetical protein ACFWA4_05795 [Streptomyces sp. NPDC060011]|uniref:hypothetical protein n=1 Tax=Streptomyces sp. NPDC060011 TaxID=3347037 RepID=UPI00369048CA
MGNVPAPRPEHDESARRHVAIARQLLVETDDLDYSELNEKDLCRLIGRYEVVIAMLILSIEGGEQ